MGLPRKGKDHLHRFVIVFGLAVDPATQNHHGVRSDNEDALLGACARWFALPYKEPAHRAGLPARQLARGIMGTLRQVVI